MKQAEVREFDPARVRPLPGQPRKRFRGIADLAASIAEVGLLQAGIVTLIDDDAPGGKAFDAELIDGERRLRACVIAGVAFRAEVRGIADRESIFTASFAANFGKQDHDALEIAEGLDQLRQTKTIEQLGRIAGRSVGWVTSHLSLLNLHADVRKLMIVDDVHESPRLTFSLALLLTSLDHAEQIRLARQIVKGEGMSMVAARRMVLRAAPAASRLTGGRPRARSMQALKSTLSDASDRIGIYLDLPGPDIDAAIDAVDHREKRLLIEAIETLTSDLFDLGEKIESRLPKAGRKAS